tara:strand:+ start:119 stop:280 length:162 start_codon:yes stop_codon:yes gene_type:complete
MVQIQFFLQLPQQVVVKEEDSKQQVLQVPLVEVLVVEIVRRMALVVVQEIHPL